MTASISLTRRTTLRPAIPTGPRQVMVGFPRGAASSFVINKAIWNEFGTRHIPERPFLRRAMSGNRSKYGLFLAARAKDIVEQRDTCERVINQLGLLAVGDIQHEITALRTPPNAPATIKAKGSSNPLIDTGEMRQSVTYRVIMEGAAASTRPAPEPAGLPVIYDVAR